jgi:DNA mismatch repair protein MutS
VAMPPKSSAIEEKLKAIHPDDLTPMEALRLIYALKSALP